MLTEDEAKEKLCLQKADCVGRYGGEVTFPPHSRCIGSACMAWRWRSEYDALNVDTDELRPLGIGFDALRADEMKVPRYEKGYCGLAGPAS